jgi:hypothetical protein
MEWVTNKNIKHKKIYQDILDKNTGGKKKMTYKRKANIKSITQVNAGKKSKNYTQ